MSVKTKIKTETSPKSEAEIKKLNQMAKRAMKKDTPEYKKIFDAHAEAWKELANK